jgi:glutaredoxin
LQAEKLKISGLFEKVKNISADNYVDVYEQVIDLKIISNLPKPIAYQPLEISNEKRTSQQNKLINNDYNCPRGGTASENIHWMDRGNLRADTYMVGDNYVFTYNDCATNGVTYNGKRRFSVDSFSKFDFSRIGAGAPMGKFFLEYNNYSRETDKLKITLNGKLEYVASANYPALRDALPSKLSKRYSVVSNFTVTLLDKESNNETVLKYGGIGVIEHLTYTQKVTKRLHKEDQYTYCRLSSYTLGITKNSESVEVPIQKTFCGDVASSGAVELLPPRIVRQSFGDTYASMRVGNSRIMAFILADGSTRTIFQENVIDPSNMIQAPDAKHDDKKPTTELPPTDTFDIMNGIHVIGFDACVPTTRARKYLDDRNISYTYISTDRLTQNDAKALEWLNFFAVPYVGINGNYYTHTSDYMLKIEGIIK